MLQSAHTGLQAVRRRDIEAEQSGARTKRVDPRDEFLDIRFED